MLLAYLSVSPLAGFESELLIAVDGRTRPLHGLPLDFGFDIDRPILDRGVGGGAVHVHDVDGQVRHHNSTDTALLYVSHP